MKDFSGEALKIAQDWHNCKTTEELATIISRALESAYRRGREDRLHRCPSCCVLDGKRKVCCLVEGHTDRCVWE
jgi:hypothetical protein